MRQVAPPWALVYSLPDRQGHCWLHHTVGATGSAPVGGCHHPPSWEQPSVGPSEHVAPPPPLARIGSGRGRGQRGRRSRLFRIGGRGGSSPEADGGGGGGGGGPSSPPGLRLCLRLGSFGSGHGSDASPASGPVGRLPAGLGGAPAGLPRHPGKC